MNLMVLPNQLYLIVKLYNNRPELLPDTHEPSLQVQFSDAFQSVTAKRAIKQKLRSILWVKYQIKDNDVFDKAYQYIEHYY